MVFLASSRLFYKVSESLSGLVSLLLTYLPSSCTPNTICRVEFRKWYLTKSSTSQIIRWDNFVCFNMHLNLKIYCGPFSLSEGTPQFKSSRRKHPKKSRILIDSSWVIHIIFQINFMPTYGRMQTVPHSALAVVEEFYWRKTENI